MLVVDKPRESRVLRYSLCDPCFELPAYERSDRVETVLMMTFAKEIDT